MSNNKPIRKRVVLILGVALIAAAWLIAGPDMLENLGLTGRVADVLVNAPAMLLFFWMISKNRGFMRCEYRAWKRLIGR